MGKIVSSVLDPITGAGAARDAANAAAQQQRDAAQASAAAAAFRPIGMTTRFGTSQFTREIDPRTGMPYVSAAGYTAAPELAALQNRLFGQFSPLLTQAEDITAQYGALGPAASQLMSLGSQYLAQTPEQAAQEFMTSQQALLAPAREQQLSSLRNKVFQTGRGGLGVGGTLAGGRGASNPEMQAYYNALAQQDLQLAANAQQAGRERATFGAGLLGTGAGLLGTQVQGQVGALSPLQSVLGLTGNIENMAQMPLNLGLQIGTASLPGQTAGAQIYNQGFTNAAQTQAQGAMQAAQLNSAFLNNLIGSAAGAYGMSQMGGARALGSSAGGLGSLNWTSPLSGAMSSMGSGFGIPVSPVSGAFGMNPAMTGGFGLRI